MKDSGSSEKALMKPVCRIRVGEASGSQRDYRTAWTRASAHLVLLSEDSHDEGLHRRRSDMLGVQNDNASELLHRYALEKEVDNQNTRRDGDDAAFLVRGLPASETVAGHEHGRCT